MQPGSSHPPDPENHSFASILGQLLIATIVGAALPLKVMMRGDQHVKAEQIPIYMVGFGGVGFCAGLMLVLNDVAKKGSERSKSRGESLAKWKLLHLCAALLVLPVVIGFCMIMAILFY